MTDSTIGMLILFIFAMVMLICLGHFYGVTWEGARQYKERYELCVKESLKIEVEEIE